MDNFTNIENDLFNSLLLDLESFEHLDPNISNNNNESYNDNIPVYFTSKGKNINTDKIHEKLEKMNKERMKTYLDQVFFDLTTTKINFMCIGLPRSGKSTLIQAITGKPIETNNCFNHVTTELNRYVFKSSKSLEINFWDTIGLENFDKNIFSIYNEICVLSKTPRIDTIIFCLRKGNFISEKNQIKFKDIIKYFVNREIPIIITLTDCLSYNEHDLKINLNYLHNLIEISLEELKLHHKEEYMLKYVSEEDAWTSFFRSTNKMINILPINSIREVKRNHVDEQLNIDVLSDMILDNLDKVQVLKLFNYFKDNRNYFNKLKDNFALNIHFLIMNIYDEEKAEIFVKNYLTNQIEKKLKRDYYYYKEIRKE